MHISPVGNGSIALAGHAELVDFVLVVAFCVATGKPDEFVVITV
jgi:hypothetical protein